MFIAFYIPSKKKNLATPTLQKRLNFLLKSLQVYNLYIHGRDRVFIARNIFLKYGLCLSWVALQKSFNSLRMGHFICIIDIIISSTPALKSFGKTKNYTEKQVFAAERGYEWMIL